MSKIRDLYPFIPEDDVVSEEEIKTLAKVSKILEKKWGIEPTKFIVDKPFSKKEDASVSLYYSYKNLRMRVSCMFTDGIGRVNNHRKIEDLTDKIFISGSLSHPYLEGDEIIVNCITDLESLKRVTWSTYKVYLRKKNGKTYLIEKNVKLMSPEKLYDYLSDLEHNLNLQMYKAIY